MAPLRLALVVQGRFYMFDLARELILLGHDVTLFTNYPKRICERFGVPRARVVNNLAHGIASRGQMKIWPGGLGGRVERWCNTAFGRWARRAVLARGRWDAVVCMSGIAEDLFNGLGGTATLRVLHRGSAHIGEQKRILAEEERAGEGRVEQPSSWIIAREEREYHLADLIHVQSPFAMQSFVRAGVPLEKLEVLQLGVNVSQFNAAPAVTEERCRRVVGGGPLRIICAGIFARRKGSRVWAELFSRCSIPPALIRFVGPILPDGAANAAALRGHVEFIPKVPQAELPSQYRWADLFVLPTLEDGFALVVTQALASGLPVITTTSCGASALVENGSTGWVIPPASADALAERICWADAHRPELAAAACRLSNCEFSRDWKNVAREMAQSIENRLSARAGSAVIGGS